MVLEEETLSRNIESISKSLGISIFGIVEYSVSSESGRFIAIYDKVYSVPELPKYLCIIYLQGICTSEIYRSFFVYNCYDKHESYAELKLKLERSGWK